jgi:hypothetical protein
MEPTRRFVSAPAEPWAPGPMGTATAGRTAEPQPEEPELAELPTDAAELIISVSLIDELRAAAK